MRVKVSWPQFLTENAGYSDNASYSDMTFEQKVSHYAKQNLLAQSLHPIAYEKKPGVGERIHIDDGFQVVGIGQSERPLIPRWRCAGDS